MVGEKQTRRYVQLVPLITIYPPTKDWVSDRNITQKSREPCRPGMLPVSIMVRVFELCEAWVMQLECTNICVKCNLTLFA